MGILLVVSSTRSLGPILIDAANPHKAMGTFTLVIPVAFTVQVLFTGSGMPNLMTIISASVCLVLGIVLAGFQMFSNYNPERAKALYNFREPENSQQIKVILNK